MELNRIDVLPPAPPEPPAVPPLLAAPLLDAPPPPLAPSPCKRNEFKIFQPNENFSYQNNWTAENDFAEMRCAWWNVEQSRRLTSIDCVDKFLSHRFCEIESVQAKLLRTSNFETLPTLSSPKFTTSTETLFFFSFFATLTFISK